MQTNPYSKYTIINVNYIILVNEQKVNESRKQIMDRCKHAGMLQQSCTFLTTS